MDAATERFIKDLRQICEAHDVKIKFSNTKTVLVEGKIRSSGYFDAVDQILAVSKNREDWLSLLAHESSHVDQWIEETKIWLAEDKFGNEIIDSWLSGNEVKNLRKAFNRVIDLELDCEKRTLKKIVDYDLPINTVTYIQKANAYLLFHNRCYETRKWVTGLNAPYCNPMIYQNMPKRFMSARWYKKFTDRQRKIFLDAGL